MDALSWQAWYTIAVVVVLFLAMIFTKIRSDAAFLLAVAALYIPGVLDVKAAFGGIASETVLVVGAMFCVIAGLTYSGVLNWVVKHLMGVPKSLSVAIVRIMVPVAALSSVMSNATVVALFVNVVKLWSKRLGVAPSKLLIPLSYASGMGGICTLIGTPPNLIISGMYAKSSGVQMGLFAPLICGLFCLAVGILSLLAMQKLLPVRKSPIDNVSEEDFTTELTVPSDNQYVGMTLSQMYDSIGFMWKSTPGVTEAMGVTGTAETPGTTETPGAPGTGRVWGEAPIEISEGVIRRLAEGANPSSRAPRPRVRYSPGAPGTGRVWGEAPIEIIAVRRFDNDVVHPVERDEFIMGGDRVLVGGSVSKINRFAHMTGFKNNVLEAAIDCGDSAPVSGWKKVASSLVLVAALTLSALNILTLLESCVIAAVAMLILRCCTAGKAVNSINWEILIIFSGSMAIGHAFEQTGVAQAMANGILEVCGSNPYVVLTAICLVGTFVTEFISNTAAAAMFYPIAMSAAVATGANPVTFCIALMISVSSSFATPIGSPTHMLVYTPGGYKFSDFALIGIPMNIIILAANIFITTLVYPL